MQLKRISFLVLLTIVPFFLLKSMELKQDHSNKELIEIMVAIKAGSTDTVMSLLDTTEKHKEYLNPLLEYAIHKCAFSVIPLLIERGADITTRNCGGHICLSSMIWRYSRKKKSRKIQVTNDTNKNFIETLKLLTNEHTINAFSINPNIRNPLIIAIINREEDAVKFLLENNADVYATCPKNLVCINSEAKLTPLDIAYKSSNETIVALLEQKINL